MSGRGADPVEIPERGERESPRTGRPGSVVAGRAARRYRWGLVAILATAALGRFWSIGTSPGWFVDEGTYFDVARNLLHGKRLVGQMEVTFASPHMTAPPGWLAAEAVWMGVFGETMTSFRWLTGLCGLACVAMAARIGRRLGGWKAGLWAAGFLAVAPRAILYSRMGIPYTPAAAMALAWIGATMEWEAAPTVWKRGGFLVLACLAAAAAPLTVYYGVVVIPAGLVWAGTVFWIGRRRRAALPWPLLLPPLCATLALGGFLVYGWMAWGEVFRTDFRALRANAASAGLEDQARHWKEYLFHWTMYGNVWERLRGVIPFLGFAGLLFLRRRAASLVVGATAFGFAFVVLRRLDAIVAFIDYPMMTVFPFLCIGMGMLAGRPVGRTLWRRLTFGDGRTARGGGREGGRRKGRGGWVVAPAITAGLGGALGLYSLVSLATGWTKPNPPTLSFGMAPSVENARAAAAWANDHAKTMEREGRGGLVLASTNLWPLLTVPHADINQWMAAQGRGSGFYNYDCAAAATPALRGAATVGRSDSGAERNDAAAKERGGTEPAPAGVADGIVVFIEGPFTELRRRPAHDNVEHIPKDSPWMDLAKAIQAIHETWPVAFRADPYVVRIPPPGNGSWSSGESVRPSEGRIPLPKP